MNSLKLNGVHFVGSVLVSSAETCFRTLSAALPGQLQRLPDGEPGLRDNFVRWQLTVLKSCDSRLLGEIYDPSTPSRYSEDDIKDILRSLDKFETQYDEHALRSYEIFKVLKKEGVIEKHVRFQVCLPTPVNVVFICVHSTLRSKVEPIYRQALLRSLRRIQDGIPHGELSIQVDCPTEIGLIEEASFYGRMNF